MKGPVLFFIQYAGQLISYGRLGIFIIQWVNLFLSLVIISMLFDRFQIRNRFLQLLLMLPLAYIAGITFEGGNLTEEFSLVPLLSCLYLCFTFLENGEHPDKNCRERLFWYAGLWFGFCFGILLLIRITNAALICATALSVGICLLKDREFRRLAICISMFFAGLIAAVLPAVLFFGIQGALREMYEAVFVLGVKYSGEKTVLQHLSETFRGERKQLLLLLAVPCLAPFLLHWRGRRERAAASVCALFTFFAIALGNNYTHYYTLTIPLVVLTEIAAAESLRVKTFQRTVLALALTMTMLLPQYALFRTCYAKAYSHLFLQSSYDRQQMVEDISSRIPEEDSGSIFCYNLDPSWYTYADLFPCIKYCGWQNHYISLMPEILDDLEAAFSAQPPAWLVLPAERGELPDFLEETLDLSYQQIYRNSSYSLYHCKNETQ